MEEKTPVEQSNDETVEAVKAKYEADIAALNSTIDNLSAQIIERNKTIQELLDGDDIGRPEEDDFADVRKKLRFVNI